MYDSVQHVVSFTLDFDKDTDIPYVHNSGANALKDKAKVVQDFNSGCFTHLCWMFAFAGFEYVLSRDGRVCSHAGELQSTWDDVAKIGNNLVLRDPTNVFFNSTQQQVYYAGEVCHTFDVPISCLRLWKTASLMTPMSQRNWLTPLTMLLLNCCSHCLTGVQTMSKPRRSIQSFNITRYLKLIGCSMNWCLEWITCTHQPNSNPIQFHPE